MRVFVTGASGFIGSRIVPELIGAGHQVLGMTRSDSGAKFLESVGAEVHRGDLDDIDSMRRGAEASDGVIHTAFNHDFTNFVANCENDKRVIEAMGEVLAGSDRPMVVTSGVGFGIAAPGELASEDVFNTMHGNPRVASEIASNELAERGVNVSIMRLPQVHDTEKQGLLTPFIEISRAKGSVAYVGEGHNRFSAAHVLDVARLYRLAFEKGERGSRYNAVDEEGVALREIAEVIGRGLKLPVVSLTPEEAPAHFGWMAMFAGFDLPASGALTQQRLGWHPTGPGLIEDLENMQY